MSSASAMLFYGTSVKAAPLIFASDAWPKTRPVWLALDMIAARRSKETLKVKEGEADVGKLPVEVLAIVKEEVAHLEVEPVEQQLAKKYPCYMDALNIDWNEMTSNFYFTTYPCSFPNWKHEQCREPFLGMYGVHGFAGEHEKNTARLLQDFRLCRPRNTLISLEGDSWGDLDSLVALALSLRSSSSSLSSFPSADTTDTSFGNEYEPTNGIMKPRWARSSSGRFDPRQPLIQDVPPRATGPEQFNCSALLPFLLSRH